MYTSLTEFALRIKLTSICFICPGRAWPNENDGNSRLKEILVAMHKTVLPIAVFGKRGAGSEGGNVSNSQDIVAFPTLILSLIPSPSPRTSGEQGSKIPWVSVNKHRRTPTPPKRKRFHPAHGEPPALSQPPNLSKTTSLGQPPQHQYRIKIRKKQKIFPEHAMGK